jgi:prolyl-tRNA synthetase family II
MRWSQLFIPTLRENPGGVESASHRLLLRGGYMRQLMSGHYTLLLLGTRVRHKVIRIIREEMDRIGGQELLCPTMHPADIWRQSGRWTTMGQEMFRLKDRKDADLALGMTHEEIFTDVSRELSSYRDLPQIWYQVQTKFRDEPRPKAGILRTREFTMKDAYSFDVDEAGLDLSFDRHHEAYGRIFTRLDLPFIPVQASSGNMGGTDSVEFMAPCEAGEDDIVVCEKCDYAANMERAESPVEPAAEREPSPPVERFDTPGVRTIQALADPPYGVTGPRQIKTLVYVIDDQVTLVLLRGDHALVEQKLIDLTGAVELRPAHPEEIKEVLGAMPGSLGAVGRSDLPVIADTALRGERDMTTGANTDDVHVRHVDVDRDIEVGTWANLRAVREGDVCPSCGGELHIDRAVEIGHIFKLGRKYTTAMGVRVLDQSGAELTPIMGSYGIGVERNMATIVETHHDDAGIVWPVSVAPFEVAVVPLGGDEVVARAEGIYQELLAAGVDAIIDDRDERPGAKLKDVELVGIPYRIVIGARGLKNGVGELTTRATSTTVELPLADIAAEATKTITQAKSPTPT